MSLQHYVPLQASEDVTITVASANSTIAPSRASHARISATTALRYRVGLGTGTVTAVTTDAYLPAGVVEFIPCCAGQKLGAIREAADGKLNVTFVDGI